MHIDISARKDNVSLDEIYQRIKSSSFDKRQINSNLSGMVMYTSLILGKESQYFKLEPGGVVYMLTCYPKGSAPNPLCRARFDKSNVVVEYDFSLVHLPNYLNIDKAVKSLMSDLMK